MIKKYALVLSLLIMFSTGLLGIEVGIFAGSVSKPKHNLAGLSVGTGFMVPMLKLEAEYYKMTNVSLLELPKAISIGVKVRPRFGSLAPYGIVGIGMEFDKFNFKSSESDKFSFIGGGLHFYITGMVSLRGDVRLLHFKYGNRTRVTGGVFIHF